MDEWREVVAAARAAWPDFHVEDQVFVGHLSRCAGAAAELLPHAADLYLACACAGGDAIALARFDHHVLAPIAGHVKRLGEDLDVVNETLQVLRTRLFMSERGQPPRIAQYLGQGTLLGWVKVAAVRTAIDLGRRHPPAQPTGEHLSQLELAAADDPELKYIKGRYAGDFKAALAEALDALSADDRTVLRLYVIDQLNIAEIGGVFNVHRATVARWITQTRARLAKNLRVRLRKRLGTSSSEVESLMRLFDSDLRTSLLDCL
jgi:RNA polymerase sigma-70 factor (ECF subfamily)